MAATGPTSGRDILLLLLYVPGATGEFNEPIRGRTRLTKIMFIFEKEIYEAYRFDRIIPANEMPEFYAWDFGPFSKDIFDDIEFFRRIGFIEVRATTELEAGVEEAGEHQRWQEMASADEETDPGDYAEFTEETFQLTDRAISFIEKEGLYEALSDNQRSILQEYKRRFNGASLYAILQYVYGKYPDMTKQSKIKGRVAF